MFFALAPRLQFKSFLNSEASAKSSTLAVTMTILTIQRNISVWLLFLVTVLISGLFTFINVSEFVSVGILQQTKGYPFGGEGPAPWFYKTPQLYATVNLVFGLLFFSTLAFSCWTFIKVKKSPLFVALLATMLIVFIQFLNGQSVWDYLSCSSCIIYYNLPMDKNTLNILL